MSEVDLRGIVETLRAALSGRALLADDVDAGYLVDQHMLLAVLDTYKEELDALNEADAIAWLVRRTAENEARMLVLQKLLVHELRPLTRAVAAKQESWAPSPISEATPKLASEAAPVSVAIAPGKPVQPDTAGDPDQSKDALAETLGLFMTAPDVYQVDFDPSLVQNGFYAAEQGDDRRWFRWLGPEPKASLFVPRIEGPFRVILKVVAVFPSGALAKTRISIDGGEWVGCEISAEKGADILAAVPPYSNAFGSSTLQIDIDCGVTESPSDFGQPDSRHLGIAICSLQLQRLDDGQA